MSKAICRYADCLNHYDTYLELNVIQRLGPVLISEKPMHVFCFNKSFQFKDQLIKDIHLMFHQSDKYRYRIFESTNQSTKILFYNVQNMTHLLADHRNLNFLKSLNYDIEKDMEYYMDRLEGHLVHNQLPPEFGLFFGYPLKDVIGFIGHPSLKHVKTKGWKFYGDVRLSDQVFNDFESAENEITAIFNQVSKLGLVPYLESA